MANKVFLICAGGHAKQVIDVFLHSGFIIEGVFDDIKTGTFYRNTKIVGTLSDLKKYEHCQIPFFITLGDNKLRKKIAGENPKLLWTNCVSLAYAYVSPTVTMGYGNYIGPHTRILSDTIIGNFNIINDGATITHDNFIGNYNHIAPSASLGGRVKIGDCNLIGTNATLNPDVYLCNEIIIGSGSVVLRDIFEKGTYVGVPCKGNFIK